jgi:hypothetical protein
MTWVTDKVRMTLDYEYGNPDLGHYNKLGVVTKKIGLNWVTGKVRMTQQKS